MARTKQIQTNPLHVFGVVRNQLGTGIDNSAELILIVYAAILLKLNLNTSNADDLDKTFNKIISIEVNDKNLQTHLKIAFEKFKPAISSLAKNCTSEELNDFILSQDWIDSTGSHRRGGMYCTPKSVTNLALTILNINKDDRVADLGCGVGSFLSKVAQKNSTASLYGVEINEMAACAAKAVCALSTDNATIEIGDMLEKMKSKSFDKIFCNSPFGISSSSMTGRGKYYEILKSGMDGFGRPSTADWVFAKLAYDSLDENGIALIIMTPGAMFNGSFKQAREYFINNNMIQAIIALPTNLFLDTGIATVALVLGKNSGAIRMVDASDLFIAGRRRNSMGNDEIKEVLHRLTEDGNSSRLIGKSEISSTEYSLFPPRYLERKIELVNPVCIDDIALSIERGAHYKASELDKMATDEDTEYSYLKLGDISDGRIGNNLTHLSYIDEKTEKQWLHNGDLVISKSGAPFKIAVAEISEGQTILANGNLYILRLDPEKANPYYVAAFLTSEDGKELLGRATVGTTIPDLPLRNLKRLEISLPPLDEQKEIARTYQSRLDEIEVLRIKLEKARIAADETYDEIMEL